MIFSPGVSKDLQCQGRKALRRGNSRVGVGKPQTKKNRPYGEKNSSAIVEFL